MEPFKLLGLTLVLFFICVLIASIILEVLNIDSIFSLFSLKEHNIDETLKFEVGTFLSKKFQNHQAYSIDLKKVKEHKGYEYRIEAYLKSKYAKYKDIYVRYFFSNSTNFFICISSEITEESCFSAFLIKEFDAEFCKRHYLKNYILMGESSFFNKCNFIIIEEYYDIPISLSKVINDEEINKEEKKKEMVDSLNLNIIKIFEYAKNIDDIDILVSISEYKEDIDIGKDYISEQKKENESSYTEIYTKLKDSMDNVYTSLKLFKELKDSQTLNSEKEIEIQDNIDKEVDVCSKLLNLKKD